MWPHWVSALSEWIHRIRARHMREGAGKSRGPGRVSRGPGSESMLGAGSLVELGDVVPVDEVVDKGLQVVGTPVAIVDVIGMFPDVAAENRGGAVDQRILAVR